MPQIFMMLAPEAQIFSDPEELDDIGKELIDLTEQIFGIEGRNDVAFDILNLSHTIYEKPIQIEVRYTVGEDEYGQGKPFDPSRQKKEKLASAIIEKMKKWARSDLRVSVWIKPIRDSVFTS